MNLSDFVNINYGIVVNRYEHLGNNCKNCAKVDQPKIAQYRLYTNGQVREFCRSIPQDQILNSGDLLIYNKYPFNVVEVNEVGMIADSNYFIIRASQRSINKNFLRELLIFFTNQGFNDSKSAVSDREAKGQLLKINDLKNQSLSKLQHLNLVQNNKLTKYMWVMLLFSLVMIFFLIIVLILNGVFANLAAANNYVVQYFLVVELLACVLAGPTLIAFFVLFFKKNFICFKIKRHFVKRKNRDSHSDFNKRESMQAAKLLVTEDLLSDHEYELLIQRIEAKN